MNPVQIQYDHVCLVSKDAIVAAAMHCQPEVHRIKTAVQQGYQTEYASLYAPYDSTMHAAVAELVEQKKALNPRALVIIGIGGSNLGTIAVHEAVHGRFYNEQQPTLQCYFADTIEADYTYTLLALVEAVLQKQEAVLITLISKSGLTTETDANAACFIQLLKRYHPHDYQRYIVVISDEGSALWKSANQDNYDVLTVPKLVGGRYSVFSPVGLFPLGMLGIDTHKLCQGARDATVRMVDEGVKNNAVVTAAILALHYKQGIRVHDTFIFSPDLESVGRWYRQLLGESIGKEYNRAGSLVEVGFTPTVSVGTTDLHSVAQRYLAGPRDIFTTFMQCQTTEHTVTLPEKKVYPTVVSAIQGKTISYILNAIVEGVQRAYSHSKRPFISCTLHDKSAYTLGQLMQWKMLETMYLGFLLGVNPFDQPNVELYKEETRKILAHE